VGNRQADRRVASKCVSRNRSKTVTDLKKNALITGVIIKWPMLGPNSGHLRYRCRTSSLILLN
jgi:hypothetical protein